MLQAGIEKCSMQIRNKQNRMSNHARQICHQLCPTSLLASWVGEVLHSQRVVYFSLSWMVALLESSSALCSILLVIVCVTRCSDEASKCSCDSAVATICPTCLETGRSCLGSRGEAVSVAGKLSASRNPARSFL